MKVSDETTPTSSNLFRAYEMVTQHMKGEEKHYAVCASLLSNALGSHDTEFRKNVLNVFECMHILIITRSGDVRDMDPEVFKRAYAVVNIRTDLMRLYTKDIISMEKMRRLIQMSESSLEDLEVVSTIIDNIKRTNSEAAV